MKLKRHLLSRMKGDDVRELQGELRRLGHAITDKKGFFGKTTRRAVRAFQKERGLEATGVVDETTAGELELALGADSPGAPGGGGADRGEPDGGNFGSLELRLSDSGGDLVHDQVAVLLTNTRLKSRRRRAAVTFQGEPVTLTGIPAHPDGFYHVAIAPKRYRRTAVFVGISPNRTATVEKTLLRLGERPPEKPDPDDRYLVGGRVVEPDGSPVAGLTVRAFARSLRRETALGEPDDTDDAGRYAIVYPPPRNRVDLFVRASGPQGDVISAVVSGAGPREVLDLVLGDEPLTGPSEIDRFHRALGTVLEEEGVAEEELGELGEEEIALLAARSGIEPSYVVLLRQAVLLAKQTGLPADLLYGMGRKKIPLSLSGMLAQGPDRRREAVEAALRDHLIPARLRREAAAALGKLDELAIAEALRNPEVPGLSTLGSYFTLAGLAAPKHEKLVRAYAAHQGPIADFWQGVRRDREFSDAEVRTLQLSLQLGAAAQNHAPLVRILLQQEQVTEPSDIARYDRADWQGLLQADAGGHSVGLPADLEAAGFGEAEFADLLFKVAEDAFPTAMVARRLDRLPQGELLRPFFDRQQDPGTGLETFEMRTTPVAVYLRENPGAFDGLDESEKVVASLKGIERTWRLAPRGRRFETVQVLLADGLDSAQKIRTLGKAAFEDRYGATFGKDQTLQVFARANNASAVASVVLARYGALFDKTPMAVLPERPERLEGFPDWETLFGSLDFCSCEHCQSVYSPAAYLTDILHWLHDRPSRTAGRTVLDVLFEGRRADIGGIELSCKNTHTPLPYVDLVNEVLELAVAPPDEPPAYQTRCDADDLAAHPEHLHAAAYEVLAGAATATGRDGVYPFDLPFNLWLEETRTYLGQLGVPRYHLMEVFHSGGREAALTDPAVAREVLGLSELEKRIIAGQTLTPARSSRVLWGMAGESTWVRKLKQVSLLLEKATPPLAERGMEFEELADLLRTRFVQVDGQIGVWFESVTCDTGRATLHGLTSPALRRLQRFLRLQRRLGWKPQDLDRAIQVLGGGALNKRLLVKLSQVLRLAGELRVPVDELLTWWGPLDTRRWQQRLVRGRPPEVPPGDPGFGFVYGTALTPQPSASEDRSFYDRLFQSPSVRAEPDPAFGIDPQGEELLDESPALAAHLPAVAAGLGTTSEDLARILPRLADDRLRLANLSALYRHVSLARALDLGVGHLASLLALTGLDPFDWEHPEWTVRFVDEVRAVQESGFSVEELDYLLRHADTKPATLEPGDAEIGTLLRELRDALRQAEADHPDRTGPATEAAAVEKLASALGLEPAVLESYLHHTPPAGPPALEALRERALIDFEKRDGDGEELLPVAVDLPEQFAAYRRLDKVALLLQRFRITREEVPWVFVHGPARGTLDVGTLPVAPLSGDDEIPYRPWARLRDAVALRDRFTTGKLFDLFAEAAAFDPAGDAAAAAGELLAELGKRTRWDGSDLAFLAGSGGFDLAYPDDWQDEVAPKRLAGAMAAVRRIGLSAEVLWEWRTVPGSPAGQREQAEAVKQAVRARYQPAGWREVARPLRDRLRERQRSALAGWLVAHDRRFGDVHALFEHFLLDVEMSPCQLTSRIKQAASSVQLFVQRALMNLEPEVALSAGAAREWKWMRNYRVWEANRKVFLYPENWIEPELRDDKSPFFEELENDLLQDEMTAETAERAARKYLEKLDEVARLEVVGLFHQREAATGSQPATDVLHVFGRTRGTPPRYFYRRRVDAAYWTPWERVDVDVEGDHLLPVVYNRRLYVFWLMITEAALEEKPPDTPSGGGDTTAAEPTRYYKIRLAWSQLQDGKWTAKKLSNVSVGDEVASTPPKGLRKTRISRPSDFFLRSVGDTGSDDLLLEPIRWFRTGLKVAETGEEFAHYVRLDRFRLSGCDGTLSLEEPTGAFPTVRRPDRTRTYNQSFASRAETEDLTLPARDPRAGTFENLRTLSELPGPFEVVPAKLDDFRSRSPFFFQDRRRTFFVEPRDLYGERRLGSQPPAWTDPDDVMPDPGQWRRGREHWIFDPRDFEIDPGEFETDPWDDVTDPWIYDPGSLAIDPRRLLPEIPFPSLVITDEPTFGEGDPGDVFDRPTHGGGDLLDVPARPEGAGGLPGFDAWSLGDALDARVRFIGDRPVAPRPRALAVDATVRIVTLNPGRELLTLRTSGGPGIGGGPARLTADATYYQPPFGWVDPASEPAIKTWEGKRYRFDAFYHPYVCELRRELNRLGIDGLWDPSPGGPQPGLRRQQLAGEYFASDYGPVAVDEPYPRDEFDFSPGGAYSIYNWELFFHLPFLVACRLSENQRFEEALRWFHYVFDPTEAGAGDAPQRFWKVRPFYEHFHLEDAGAGPIHELFLLLGDPGDEPARLKARDDLVAQIARWRDDPFKPHAIARLRPAAYQKAVVMKYLDNLIAWGDQLFRRDTLESINEATQLYVLAAQILGRRPQRVEVEPPAPRTFRQLLALGLDEFSNAAAAELEGYLAEVTDRSGHAVQDDVPVVGPTYFCVPPNDQLIAEYWDRVADRLFKIRHCMNIEGVVRQLPLFEPPIDPALLVRAAAAGVDLAAALADLEAPLPFHRFQVLSQKATELCADVRALGAALLSALEKKDAEALALLRAGHEVKVHNAVKAVREQQIEEAEETLEGLRKSKENAELRLQYYQSRQFMSPKELLQVAKLESARTWQERAEIADLVGSILGALPNLDIGICGFGGSPVVKASWGSPQMIQIAKAVGDVFRMEASDASHDAQMASIGAGYERRADDWGLQADLATKDAEAAEKQILAAEVRLAIARKELENLELQLANAEEVDEFLRDKFTHQELYQWMSGQLSSLYFQSYQLAYDVARRAERAWQFELASPDKSFLQFGYWDSLKKGLLAGERLHHDLKRMEAAYLEKDRRDYELTGHVSLRLLDPVALVRLRRDGECIVQVPETWFDLDSPGHFFRRLKSVALSIPSVTGPYTPVRCTLTLTRSEVRINADLGPGYARTGPDDARFRADAAGVQAIVTSRGQEDSGLFETNLRDERYLPFEGMGAISEWRLELPGTFRRFDYDTISDVVLHLRYTAREGGKDFKEKAEGALAGALKTADQGALHLFSARRDFPDTWHRFLHPLEDETDQSLVFQLDKDRFPFAFQGSGIKILSIALFLGVDGDELETYAEKPAVKLHLIPPGGGDGDPIDLPSIAAEFSGLPHGDHDYGPNGKNPGKWTVKFQEASNGDVAGIVTQEAGHLRLDPEAVEDLVVVVRYRVDVPAS